MTVMPEFRQSNRAAGRAEHLYLIELSLPVAYFGNDLQKRCRPDECGCLTRSAPLAARRHERVILALAEATWIR